MDRVFFCNSGAEAVEGLIKLARKWGKEKREGAYEIIVCEGAFHGRTLATVTASANEKYRAPFTPLPEGFLRVPFNDIEAIKAATGPNTCAVLIEPMQGEGGVNVPDDGFLPALRKWCDEAGILLLLDEVQTGIGRTGKLFCFQHYGIEPDAIAVAKALGSGFPIGAFLAKDSAALLGAGEHGTTFGGNALACEVGYSVLKYIIDNDIPAQVTQKGEHLDRRLRSLADRQPMITEVRGKGLIRAVELEKPVAETRRRPLPGGGAAGQRRQADGAPLRAAVRRDRRRAGPRRGDRRARRWRPYRKRSEDRWLRRSYWHTPAGSTPPSPFAG